MREVALVVLVSVTLVFKSPAPLTLRVSPATPEDVATYAKIVAVVQRCRKLHSRLKVQKIFFVLKSLGYPVPEHFEFREHGPYSANLAAEFQSAVNADYLREEETLADEEEDEPPYQRYDYSVGRTGEGFVARQLESDPTLAEIADEMATVAHELNARKPIQLELVATLMFLQDQGVRPELLVSVLKSVKPQYTDAEIQAALDYIRDLRHRVSFAPPPDLSSIIGLVKEGPPSDAAQDLDEEIYGGE